MKWAIITGEYPPQIGGVSDYTKIVAEALVGAGDEVMVFAPSLNAQAEMHSTVSVERLPDHFGSKGLTHLSRNLNVKSSVDQILVQYVPQAFGCRAMNVPFCLWLLAQRKKSAITIMFHEVAFPWVSHGKLFRHNFLALIHRVMSFILVRSARRLFVSIPAWEPMIHGYAGDRKVGWLPVPCNVPSAIDTVRVNALRTKFAVKPTTEIVGHFGTYGTTIAAALQHVIPRVLSDEPHKIVMLIGRGSNEFAASLRALVPSLEDRIMSTGELNSDGITDHIAICNLMLQPYPDGISSRRSTAMAALACGVPLISTSGPLTEPVWKERRAVCLVDTLEEMAIRVNLLLSDKPELARLSVFGLLLYQELFDIGRTITALRNLTMTALPEKQQTSPNEHQ